MKKINYLIYGLILGVIIACVGLRIFLTYETMTCSEGIFLSLVISGWLIVLIELIRTFYNNKDNINNNENI